MNSASFVGVDLGWYGKPTGLASITWNGKSLQLENIARIEGQPQILDWIASEAGNASCVIGVDAPLVIPNATGIRTAERDLNRDYRRYHAGCHPANLGRPFAQHVIAFSSSLATSGFQHGASIQPCQPGRYQIEVHPHAATVSLFNLSRIVKYKRGLRHDRARELRRLRSLMLTLLPQLDPPLSLTLPAIPRAGNLKPVEDQIDAAMCAYIAAHWWFWATKRNHAYGSNEAGYVIVPHRRDTATFV